MTENEAIIELQQIIDLPYGYEVSDEAAKIAIKALEKRIPKEPLLRLCGDCQRECTNCDRYVDRCPNCNGDLYVETGKPNKYCPHCGQNLDRND